MHETPAENTSQQGTTARCCKQSCQETGQEGVCTRHAIFIFCIPVSAQIKHRQMEYIKHGQRQNKNDSQHNQKKDIILENLSPCVSSQAEQKGQHDEPEQDACCKPQIMTAETAYVFRIISRLKHCIDFQGNNRQNTWHDVQNKSGQQAEKHSPSQSCDFKRGCERPGRKKRKFFLHRGLMGKQGDGVCIVGRCLPG